MGLLLIVGLAGGILGLVVGISFGLLLDGVKLNMTSIISLANDGAAHHGEEEEREDDGSVRRGITAPTQETSSGRSGDNLRRPALDVLYGRRNQWDGEVGRS